MSEHRRQPDYDFFAPTPPKNTSWGTPPTSSPGAAGTWSGPMQPPPFAGPPATPTGATWPAPPGWAAQPSPTITAHSGTVPPSGRTPGVKALITVVVAVLVLAVVGVGAAIAIPVFHAQRAKAEWRATTVTLPTTYRGAIGRDDSNLEKLLQSALGEHVPGWPDPRSRVYDTDEGRVVLVAGRTSQALVGNDFEEIERGLDDAAAKSGLTPVETEPPAGAHQMVCVEQSQARAAFCIVSGTAAVELVVVAGPDAASTSRELWTASVHR